MQSSFAERYGIVLEELRSEAVGRAEPLVSSHQSARTVGAIQAEQNVLSTITTSQPATEIAPIYHHSNTLQRSRTPVVSEMQADMPTDANPDDINVELINGYSDFSPSALTDMMGWGQFESFVSFMKTTTSA